MTKNTALVTLGVVSMTLLIIAMVSESFGKRNFMMEAARNGCDVVVNVDKTTIRCPKGEGNE